MPQRVDLAQISAFAESPVAPDRATPAKKLTGVEVGHFAAFYRKSWRGNDYLWGRLDGAERLTTVAMGGDRLTQRFFGRGADVITAALEPALTEVAGNEPLTAALRAEWARDRLRPDVVAEIDAIDRGTPAASFPALTKRIVRRRQLEILHEELPSIAAELRRDEREGVALSPSALAFLDFAEKVFDPAGRVKHGPDVLEEALDLLRVGEEDLIDEADSDRFGRVVGQTAAVTSTTLRNAVPWKGGKVALTWLRGAGLIAHFLTRLTTVRPNQSGLPALVLMALLAAGGAAYASVFVLGKGGLLLSGIGVGLMAVPLLVAARRAGWLAVPLLIAALLLPALVWNADEWLERDNPVNRFILDNPDPSTVIAAIVSFTVVGLLPGRRRRRPPRVRGPRVNPLWRR